MLDNIIAKIIDKILKKKKKKCFLVNVNNVCNVIETSLKCVM